MDTESIKTIVALVIRHALTAYGGTMLLSSNEVQSISGAVSILIAVGWSVWQKRQQKSSGAN